MLLLTILRRTFISDTKDGTNSETFDIYFTDFLIHFSDKLVFINSLITRFQLSSDLNC